ncbi:MAG: ATP-binding cassette domain-containing protein [Bacteroidetes bacterium]|nr:ATP-binding cassette domain-containing protein [Bacteroidota bacterium]
MGDTKRTNILFKFFNLIRLEKAEISSIYFYAILGGLIQLSLPLGIQSIISFVLGGAISTSLVLLIIVVILGVFVGGLLKVNQMKIIEKIQQQLFVRYSFQYANNIPLLNLKEVDNYYLPELTNHFFDTISLQKSISKLLLDIPAATIQILFGLILLSFYHPVFIFFGILLLFVVYMILRITGNKGLETSVQESDYKYKVAAYLQELARVVKTLKFSRKNKLHIVKTDNYVSGYLNARTSHFKILLYQYWTLIIFKVLVTTAMLVVGAFLLVDQQLNIGQFIAAEIVIIMIIDSVEKLIMNLDQVYDVLTSVEKITKVTEKPLEENGTVKLSNKEPLSIRAQNISFGYSDSGIVLDNVNFQINPGDKICIEGAYSSGKSTLLRLLSGAYRNFNGILMINNIPILNYDMLSLRPRIGVLLNIQDILSGTIRENICLGDDSIDYHRLDAVTEVTGLKPFIDGLKKGYETEIQPMGQHLSGRVIKKILLCRALVHRPQLLLLEEPWLGLEMNYAENIKHYLLKSLKDTTVVVVTNDKLFAEQCDQVFELESGKLNILKAKDERDKGNN